MTPKNTTAKILVACHKADSAIRNDDVYMPIQVGKALHPELDLGIQRDDTGENISSKNASYCELTALYWAWKNLKDVDIIGLAHYRRYFDLDTSPENLNKILKRHDVIALKRKSIPEPPIANLTGFLCQEDVTIAIDTLLELHPDYRKATTDYLFNNHLISQCNMFIMKWEDFCHYCDFLFSFLEQCEKRMKPHSYTRLKRNLGYIAESFQGLYILHNNLKVKYVDREEIGFTEGSGKLTGKLRKFRNWFIMKTRGRVKHLSVYPSVITGLKQDNIKIKNI